MTGENGVSHVDSAEILILSGKNETGSPSTAQGRRKRLAMGSLLSVDTQGHTVELCPSGY